MLVCARSHMLVDLHADVLTVGWNEEKQETKQDDLATGYLVALVPQLQFMCRQESILPESCRVLLESGCRDKAWCVSQGLYKPLAIRAQSEVIRAT